MPHIGCILTLYKRPDSIPMQLEALRSQTIKPTEIMLWQNAAKPEVSLDPALLKGVRHIYAKPNMGVWPRFLAGMEMKSEFICVFDDDTIPGVMWLENCMKTMRTHKGLLGTIGLRFKCSRRTPYVRFGWRNPNTKVEEVDLVGHSWFFRRDWLRYYALEPRQGGPTFGEDYHFSVALQKHLRLGTYVPPHPPNCKRMWGSLYGGTIGRDEHSLWRVKGEVAKKTVMHGQYIKSGWKTLAMRKGKK